MTVREVFVDTSAVIALLASDDEQNTSAHAAWQTMGNVEAHLLSTNYVVVETLAVVARRLGIQAVRDFQSEFLPLMRIVWVDQTLHELGLAALLTAGIRDLSLVDCVSFEVMRSMGIGEAFTFDVHFSQRGFRCIP